MGALQPGMPNPAMIPQNWEILIVDLKDCFFTIPLHPDDTVRQAPISPFVLAREAHSIFHQNAKGLHRAYRITLEEARGIVRSCPTCIAINKGVG
ncbi:POK6 protein, partial [Chloropsis hardwickii]|nr:POK6 protein [Chloropsis hardwickii]